MTVARIIKNKVGRVITARPEDGLMSVAARLTRHRIGALVVVDRAGALAGMIVEADVVRAVAGGQACAGTLTARDIMKPCQHSCTPETAESDLLDLMSESHLQHLPVISGGKLAGIVSLGDVVRLRREKIRDMLAELDQQAQDGRFTVNLKRRRATRAPLELARTG